MKKLVNYNVVIVAFCLVTLKLSGMGNNNLVESRVIELVVNPNIATSLRMSVWTGNIFYAFRPVYFIKTNANLNIMQDSALPYQVGFKNMGTISMNQDKNRVLFTESKYSDISIGRLYEMDLRDYSVRKLIDSTENVSSAVYLGSSNDEIVYYSLGNPEGVNAGYYKYNIATGSKELVLSYYSELGKEETINGFDISPDGKIMLVPIVKIEEAPKIMRYDLENKKVIDILDINLPGRNNQLLWLRYNNNGTKILYSNYAQRSFSIGPAYTSELGIYELSSGIKKILSIKPEDNAWDEWTAPCPNWSPDCRHIVYGMGMIANKSGAVGKYHLYVKTNVDEGTTSVTETPDWKLAKMFLW